MNKVAPKSSVRSHGRRGRLGDTPRRQGGVAPVSTFSVLGTDGFDIGVGTVCSRAFAADGLVNVATPYGAVATQSLPHPAHRPLALMLLKAGFSSADVIKVLTDLDHENSLGGRQLAVIGLDNAPAGYTGADNTTYANGQIGHDGRSYFIGNRLSGQAALDTAARVYAETKGPLSYRLKEVIRTAVADRFDGGGSESIAINVFRRIDRQEHAADFRGHVDVDLSQAHSAAELLAMLELQILRLELQAMARAQNDPKSSDDDYAGRPVMHLVTDADDARLLLKQLKKWYPIARAEALTDQADAARHRGDMNTVLRCYNEVVSLCPRRTELVFYWALNHLRAGLIDHPGVLQALGWAFSKEPGYRETLRSMAKTDRYLRELPSEQIERALALPNASKPPRFPSPRQQPIYVVSELAVGGAPGGPETSVATVGSSAL